MAIMKREVPTAFFIGSPAKNIKIGMIIKPPPAPTKPVINPVKSPKIINNIKFVPLLPLAVFLSVTLVSRIIVMDAINIRRAKKTIIAISLVKVKLPMVKIFSGIAGTIYFLVLNTENTAGMVKVRPVL